MDKALIELHAPGVGTQQPMPENGAAWSPGWHVRAAMVSSLSGWVNKVLGVLYIVNETCTVGIVSRRYLTTGHPSVV